MCRVDGVALGKLIGINAPEKYSLHFDSISSMDF